MPEKNPMCVDSQLIELFSAVVKRSDPNITRGQGSAILQGGGARSNTNPWDTSPTSDNEWMEMQVPHKVVATPDTTILKGAVFFAD